MYLVVIEVETPGWQVDPDQLLRTLRHSTADSDMVQHTHVRVGVGRVVLSLYLQAANRATAARWAGELARRTMATVPASQGWRIVSVRTL
jgi:hypothetical protein